ncbi:MAG: hypothetical protein HOV77_05850 [Hamadaea sp.]|uniref:hypothetical protein n=1 Tax=Hamadaea sp. TaxID=2024425 RepID=UPI0017B1111A|nr:hypothetical protein [Hamadaea sp.]NUT18688.1 hypothetical protein [Hamadaea sp.]
MRDGRLEAEPLSQVSIELGLLDGDLVAYSRGHGVAVLPPRAVGGRSQAGCRGERAPGLSWDIYNFYDDNASLTDNETMAEHQLRRPSLATTLARGKQFAISERCKIYDANDVLVLKPATAAFTTAP